MTYSKLRFNWKLEKNEDNDYFPDGRDDINAYTIYTELESPLRRRKLQAKHIFIETPQLYEFLKNASKKDISFNDYVYGPDFYDFNEYSYNKNKKECEEYPYDPDNDVRRADLVFHHQASEFSFAVCILFNKKRENFGIYVSDGTNRKIFRGKSLEEEPNELPDMPKGVKECTDALRSAFKLAYPNSSFEDIFSKVVWDDPMSQMARVAVNYLLYASCFPERVIDGLPAGLEASQYTGKANARKLTPAPQIQDTTTVTPHFCSGYFKTFRDERFTKMRGKTIFVKAYMVGGVAKTALEGVARC